MSWYMSTCYGYICQICLVSTTTNDWYSTTADIFVYFCRKDCCGTHMGHVIFTTKRLCAVKNDGIAKTCAVIDLYQLLIPPWKCQQIVITIPLIVDKVVYNLPAISSTTIKHFLVQCLTFGNKITTAITFAFTTPFKQAWTKYVYTLKLNFNLTIAIILKKYVIYEIYSFDPNKIHV